MKGKANWKPRPRRKHKNLNDRRLNKALKFANTDVNVVDPELQDLWTSQLFALFSGSKGLQRAQFIKTLSKILSPKPYSFPHNPFLLRPYCDVVMGGSNDSKSTNVDRKIEKSVLKIIGWIKDPKVDYIEYVEYQELIEVLTQRAYDKLKDKKTGEMSAESLAYLVMLMECGQYNGGNYTYHRHRIGPFTETTVSEERFFDYLYYTLYVRCTTPISNPKYELIKFIRFLALTHVTQNIFELFNVHDDRTSQASKIRYKMTKDKKHAIILVQSQWKKSVIRIRKRKNNAAVIIQKFIRGWLSRKRFGSEFRVLMKRKNADPKTDKTRKRKNWMQMALKKLEHMSAKARKKRILDENKLWHETRSKRTSKNQKQKWNPFPHYYIRESFRIIAGRDEEIHVTSLMKFVKSSPVRHLIQPFIHKLCRWALKVPSRNSSMASMKNLNIEDEDSLKDSNESTEITKDEFKKVIFMLIKEAFNKLDVGGGGLGMEEIDMFVTLMRGDCKGSSSAEKAELTELIRSVHEVLDRDGNGEVDEDEFRGFMLWAWANEVKTGSTHTIKYFMSLLCIVCCEQSIIESMQRNLRATTKLRFMDIASITQEANLGIVAEIALKQPMIETKRVRRKPRRKKKSFPIYRVTRKPQKSQEELDLDRRFSSVDETVTPIQMHDSHIRKRETGWDCKFHIVESRENRAKDRNRRTYFTNFQPHRSYSFCLPSLQGLGTMQREVDDRLKTLVEENKVPSHDEGGLRLIRNSIIMDKCIMNAYASPKQSDKMFHRRRKIHHIEALRDYKSPVHRLDQKSHIHRLGGPRGTRSMPGMDAISTST